MDTSTAGEEWLQDRGYTSEMTEELEAGLVALTKPWRRGADERRETLGGHLRLSRPRLACADLGVADLAHTAIEAATAEQR